MTYRTYIRTFDGRISEKTITADPAAAYAAFAALVGRTDLDGQKLAVALTCDNRQMAFHRFDRAPGDADYWRDKLHELPIAPKHPGGRPVEIGGRRAGMIAHEQRQAILALLAKRNAARESIPDVLPPGWARRAALKGLDEGFMVEIADVLDPLGAREDRMERARAAADAALDPWEDFED